MYDAQIVDIRMSKFLQLSTSCLSFLHNYFHGSTKLFSDLYLAKFLDTSVKSFFSCNCHKAELIEILAESRG